MQFSKRDQFKDFKFVGLWVFMIILIFVHLGNGGILDVYSLQNMGIFVWTENKIALLLRTTYITDILRIKLKG